MTFSSWIRKDLAEDDREGSEPVRDGTKRAARGGSFPSLPNETRTTSRNKLLPMSDTEARMLPSSQPR
jgi:hypothetical protein